MPHPKPTGSHDTLELDAEQARLALAASGMGTWRWTEATGEVVWDPTLEALYGLPPGGFDGQYETYLGLIHPEDRDAALAEIDRSTREGGEHHTEHRIIWPDGSIRWVEGWGRVTRGPDGRVTGMIGVSVDATARKRAEERLRENEARIRRLQNITAAISGAASIAEIAEVVIDQGVAATLAGGGVLAVVDAGGDTLEIVGEAGFRPGGLDPWRRFSLQADLPVAIAARTGTPIWGESVKVLAERYPEFAQVSRDGGFGVTGTLVVVPLVTTTSTIGAMGLRFVEDIGISLEQQEFLLALARQAAQAIDRAHAFEAERDARRAAEDAEARLAFLSRVSEVVSASLDPDETLRELAGLVVPRIAEWCMVEAVEPDGGFRSVAVAHTDPARVAWAQEVRRRYPPSPQGLGYVVEHGVSVLVPEVDESALAAVAYDEGHLQALLSLGLSSVMLVPLKVGGEVIGALSLFATGDRPRFDDDDLAFAEEIARRASIAVENARLHVAEREARMQAERSVERLAHLQAITEAGLAHLALDDALERMLSVLRLAIESDTAAILLVDEERGELVVRAAIGAEGRGMPTGRAALGEGVLGRVALGAEAVVMDDVGEIDLPPHGTGELHSIAAVPMRASGRVVGVLHAGSRTARRFTAEDVELLHLAAERVALAVDRAQLFEREHRIAETLQRSLLPERLPELPGVELAARYLPGSTDIQVGGDWYEVVPLTGGRLSAAVGDVVGRGIRAAAAMGQFRNAMRALALEGLSPARLLERLSELSIGLGREFATAMVLELDPATGMVTYSSAGHPPALVVPSSGDPWFLDGGRATPLGVEPGTAYPEAIAQLEPGSTLLVYTDGLIERRDETLEQGFDRLRAAASGEEDPNRLVDLLLDALTGEHREDDVALLAIRYVEAPNRFEISLPSRPGSVARFRSEVRGWLEEAGADEDDVADLVLAVSEACSNAVEHAGVEEGHVVLTGELRTREVVLTVQDAGRWLPPHLRFERGRGFRILRTVMDDVEISRRGDGTEVRMRRRLEDHVRTS